MAKREIGDVFYSKIEGTEDFVPVVSVDNGGGYEWDECHVWYSPEERRYYWASGSGCSCNSLSDDVRSKADLGVGDRDEAKRAFRSYLDGSYSVRAGAALDAMDEFEGFRA